MNTFKIIYKIENIPWKEINDPTVNTRLEATPNKGTCAFIILKIFKKK